MFPPVTARFHRKKERPRGMQPRYTADKNAFGGGKAWGMEIRYSAVERIAA